MATSSSSQRCVCLIQGNPETIMIPTTVASLFHPIHTRHVCLFVCFLFYFIDALTSWALQTRMELSLSGFANLQRQKTTCLQSHFFVQTNQSKPVCLTTSFMDSHAPNQYSHCPKSPRPGTRKLGITRMTQSPVEIIQTGTFLMVQWLRIHLPMQETWVQSLVGEDHTCHRATKPVCYSY